MPGVFSKSVRWILTVSKTMSKIANLFRSPAMMEKFYSSKTCSGCCLKVSWEEAAKKDSVNLAMGKATFDINSQAPNSHLIKQISDELVSGKLPCRLEFMGAFVTFPSFTVSSLVKIKTTSNMKMT